MLPLPRDEALAEAEFHTGGARRRIDELIGLDKLRLRTFDDRDDFLHIAFLENDETRYFTPCDGTRTLQAVAQRINAEFGSFGALALAAPRKGLSPPWFRACADIEERGWSWSEYRRPWLVPAVPSERRFSPETDLYMWEGLHSSITLAVGLLRGTCEWRPVEAIVSLERPRP